MKGSSSRGWLSGRLASWLALYRSIYLSTHPTNWLSLYTDCQTDRGMGGLRLDGWRWMDGWMDGWTSIFDLPTVPWTSSAHSFVTTKTSPTLVCIRILSSGLLGLI